MTTNITHPRARMIYLACSVLSILTACDDPMAPDRELQFARRRWAHHHPGSYSLTVANWCECLPAWTGPVVVVVRDGQVESRHYVPSGDPVPSAYAEFFPTVEGLFARIDDALRQHPARLEVDYDPDLGYPVRIAIDYDPQAADDEVTYIAELRE
jgi:hypothetical protein